MEAVTPQWATIMALAIPLLIAGASGVWAVWVRSQENQRAEWRRIEELIQTVHKGSEKGLWAQKLAVAELVSLKGRRKSIDPILKDAEQFFLSTSPNGSFLAAYIAEALKHEK